MAVGVGNVNINNLPLAWPGIVIRCTAPLRPCSQRDQSWRTLGCESSEWSTSVSIDVSDVVYAARYI